MFFAVHINFTSLLNSVGGVGSVDALVRGWGSWMAWVKFWYGSCGSHGSSKFWRGSKEMTEIKILLWVNIWFYELTLWFYKVLLVTLVSSLYSLHILYLNELSTQFSLFYINSYSINFMRKHYFQKSKD